MDPVVIGERKIGLDQPCFVIAEAGVNHNGDMKLAHQLVEAAAAARADAVKFQTFTAERLVTTQAPTADYQKRTAARYQTQYEMLKPLELTCSMHKELIEHCTELNLAFLSSPFDEESIELLAELHVPAIKVPSGEITNLPYLRKLREQNLPVILSTGMSSLNEVAAALEILRGGGNEQIVLLHCVSSYPADPLDCNLRVIGRLRQMFGVATGFSDHTPGAEVAPLAVAAGACVVEKHLTVSRQLPGPDHQASLEPHEFKHLVEAIRRAEAVLGTGDKQPVESERNTADIARKSVVALVDIPQNTVITATMVGMRRPGTGLSAEVLPIVIGRRTQTKIPAGSLLSLEMLA